MSTTSSGATPREGEDVPTRNARHQGTDPYGSAVAGMDLPCDWAQFLSTCAERGVEDSAIIIITTWHREGPGMTQQCYMNHWLAWRPTSVHQRTGTHSIVSKLLRRRKHRVPDHLRGDDDGPTCSDEEKEANE